MFAYVGRQNLTKIVFFAINFKKNFDFENFYIVLIYYLISIFDQRQKQKFRNLNTNIAF